jgi:MFS family permease
MAAGALASSPPVGVFGRRDFRLYMVGMFVGNVAVQIQSVAVSWQIYDLVHTPLVLGYVGLFNFLPIMLVILPAGNYADRFDRRLIYAVSAVAQAVAAGLLLALTLSGPRQTWPFYAILVLFGIGRAFAGPAQQALLPLLVPESQLPEAVAWSSSALNTAVIAGPAVGGGIYILGPAVAYGLCLVLFLTVALATSAIKTRSANRAIQPGSGLARLIAGIRYVAATPIILGSITLDLFAVLLGTATALLPVYARDILHIGPVGLGVLRSAPALGAAGVGLWLGQIPLQRRAGRVMFGCVAVFGVATIAFGLSTNLALSLFALVVWGAFDMVSVYVRGTVIQLATPDEMRGRVSAVNRLFIGASNELGAFRSGVTADWWGTVPSVVIGGLGTLAVVGVSWFAFPTLREVDKLTDVAPS